MKALLVFRAVVKRLHELPQSVKLLLAGMLVATLLWLAASIAFNKYNAALAEARVAKADVQAYQQVVERWKRINRETVARYQVQARHLQDSVKRTNAALAEALKEKNATALSYATLQARFDSLLVTNIITAGMIDSTERVFTDVLKAPPILGEIVVTVPHELAKPAKFKHQLTVSPFDITVSLACAEKNGVRIPSLFTVTPTWVHLTPSLGTVDPDVCNTPKSALTLPDHWYTPTPKRAFIAGLVTGGIFWGTVEYFRH